VPLHGAVWLCVGIEVVPADGNVRCSVNSSHLEGKHAFIDSALVIKFLDHQVSPLSLWGWGHSHDTVSWESCQRVSLVYYHHWNILCASLLSGKTDIVSSNPTNNGTCSILNVIRNFSRLIECCRGKAIKAILRGTRHALGVLDPEPLNICKFNQFLQLNRCHI
jgi:hypothetical protein